MSLKKLALKRNNKGLSLIEMVFTIGLMAIILVALATMAIVAIRNAATANNKSRAVRFAQEGIEAARYYRDVSSVGFDGLEVDKRYRLQLDDPGGWELVELGVDECENPVTLSIHTDIECAQVLTPFFKRYIEVYDQGTNTKDLRVVIWWEDGAAGKTVSMVTKLSKK